mmetsp:Transcript_63147/g.53514  ORF Transcript_63147/g.53514 Transcript_63147/m.53514 type:complete len:211 (+) Transcript_63147:361-993(+)
MRFRVDKSTYLSPSCTAKPPNSAGFTFSEMTNDSPSFLKLARASVTRDMSSTSSLIADVIVTTICLRWARMRVEKSLMTSVIMLRRPFSHSTATSLRVVSSALAMAKAMDSFFFLREMQGSPTNFAKFTFVCKASVTVLRSCSTASRMPTLLACCQSALAYRPETPKVCAGALTVDLAASGALSVDLAAKDIARTPTLDNTLRAAIFRQD